VAIVTDPPQCKKITSPGARKPFGSQIPHILTKIFQAVSENTSK